MDRYTKTPAFPGATPFGTSYAQWYVGAYLCDYACEGLKMQCVYAFEKAGATYERHDSCLFGCTDNCKAFCRSKCLD